MVKQGQHAFVDRKRKKRDYRRLWIERMNAALRAKGLKYSVFIDSMSKQSVMLNRKVLSNIAVAFPQVFDGIVQQISK